MIILKFIFLVVILVGMITILASVSLLNDPDGTSDKEETDELRKELESEDRVISNHSVFHRFLARRPDSKK